ncbi:MAG: hypothetical protein JXR94_05065 [Candidatus Hydrogenedentes bacterium]|nr:hypothetical protein [Candidatus Hydrogenedentota bacterium]
MQCIEPNHVAFMLCAAFAFVLAASVAAGAAAPETASMQTIEPIQLPEGFFPILPWDPQHGWRKPYADQKHGIESIAECAFTMAGFVQARDLPICEKLGLKAIMFGENGPISREEWAVLSDDEIDARIKALVEESGDSDAILGYYLVDEPGVELFPALGKGVAAVKKYAPGKLAYINLFPNYATIGAPDKSQLGTESYTEYLERFVNEVRPQFLSYDNYMIQYSMDTQNPGPAARYYTNLIEVRRVALKYGLPFWHIVSSNQIRPNTTIPSPANLAFQAYTSLAAGAQSVTWYTYYSRGYGYAPIDEHGDKSTTWRYLQMINRQMQILGPIMNRLESTGVFFTAPAPVESLPLLPGELVEAVECEAPVMIGEFRADDGARYLMAVNLSMERSVKIGLTLAKPYQGGNAVSAEDARLLPMNPKGGLWLVAGQGVLIRLE